jgi:hypothetical protein
MGEINVHTTLVENLKGRDYLGDLGIYGRVMLEWILGKQDG